MPDGEDEATYLEVLERLHSNLRPATYLEVGTLSGSSLALAQCASIAVDPRFALEKEVLASKPACLFFQMSSDAFFQQYNPRMLFGRAVDVVFLDGLHYAEVLLRDFINAERYVKRNSIIALHDCVPQHRDWTTRSILPGAAWAGDVWKVPLILKKYRPDIEMITIDSPPTGLVLCTNLNPDSKVLPELYFSLVNEFAHLHFDEVGVEGLKTALSIVPARELGDFEQLSRYFWL